MVKTMIIGDMKLIVGYEMKMYKQNEFDKLRNSDEMNKLIDECYKLKIINDNEYQKMKIFSNYENDLESLIDYISKEFNMNKNRISMNIIKNMILEIQDELENNLFFYVIENKEKHNLLPYKYRMFINELNNKKYIREKEIKKLVEKYNIENEYLKYIV